MGWRVGLVAVILGVNLFGGVAQGQRIFPGAVGFGTESRGAYASGDDPAVLVVDTLYAGIKKTGPNRGSFEWALREAYPRIIVFEVGGVIDYSDTSTRSVTVRHSYCNVYGQTAPSPGITLRSAALYIGGKAHDMLFQHIAVRYGDELTPNGEAYVADCVSAFSGTTNLVLDHCSFSWGTDEVIGIYSENFTLSNCLLYDALRYSYHANEKGEHEPERHCFGGVISSPGRITMYRNFWGWFTLRFPKMSTDDVAYINNYATGYALSGVDFEGNEAGENDGAFVGNSFYPTGGMTHRYAERFIYWRGPLNTDSTIYLHDNHCIGKDKGRSEFENIATKMSEEDTRAIYTDDPGSNVIDISEYRILPAGDVLDYLKANAGYRPWDRDYYDSLVLARLNDTSHRTISSTKALPARAYNRSVYEGLRTDAGNMKNGYDFSSNPVSFSVNGTDVELDENARSQKEVLDLLNGQLPDGIVAVDHPHRLCYHIIIQTEAAGADQFIAISGDASVFGIPEGTFTGDDAPYEEIVFPSNTRRLDLPADLHDDDNGNGYTNLEEWVTSFVEQRSDPVI